jgi:YHS domain-containing protein
MQKSLLTFAVLLVGAMAVLASQPRATQKSEAILSLKGFDPVMLAKGKEVKGDESLAINRGGFRYLFSSAENKALFEKEPKVYEIQMGGTCPVVPGAEGNPELYVVHKERIYIFASKGCVESFRANPDDYLKY